jgi:hypothetical protein
MPEGVVGDVAMPSAEDDLVAETAASDAKRDLDLPETDFTYLAGSTDRPWSHFLGRWRAIQPRLAEMLKNRGTRPQRICDVGACTGFFALQMAHRHPEADVIAVEGSVGIGNGTAGLNGGSRNTRQILQTGAVQTYLRWIQRLELENCFLSPEVWDYNRICELGARGRPICDAMICLSTIHHIDGVSLQQYQNLGLSRADGFVQLVGKMLLLAPRHFIELPDRPWLAAAYDAYGTQRAMLGAAATASGREWKFTGPIFSSEWFGKRELWVLEVVNPMNSVDTNHTPFTHLYKGDKGDKTNGVAGTHGMQSTARRGHRAFRPPPVADIHPLSAPLDSYSDTTLSALAHSATEPVDSRVGELLNAAPLGLLTAHLALREACAEAEEVLGTLDAKKRVV